MAGVILSGSVPNPVTFPLLIGGMCLLYVSGMFLNDAFDQEFDRKYRPERPIPAGEISGRRVYAIGFALMASGLTALFLAALLTGHGGIEVVVWGIGLAALIVYYDFRHKRDPASPVIMALCRVAVYFCAASVAGGTALSSAVLGGAGVLMAYMIGLTYVAKQETLAEIRNMWPLLFLSAPFIYTASMLPPLDLRSVQFPLFFGWVLWALSHLVRHPKHIPRAVVSLIAGISLLDGLLMASAGGAVDWSWFGLAGFLLTLFFQRYVPGT